MSGGEKIGGCDVVETIISDRFRFKASLEIGEDAYFSDRLKKMLGMLWGAVASGCVAVLIASSATIASMFFDPTGMFAVFGLGVAVTPVGWLIAAGIFAGGSWIGVKRYLEKLSRSRTKTVPHFINTPIDALGVALFDLMAPLALKVATVDGEFHSEVRQTIESHFIKQWGFDPTFVKKGVAFLESKLSDFSIREQAQSLATFTKSNKDCNYKDMSRNFLVFLREIVEADGRIDEREELALEEVQRTYRKVAQFSFRDSVRKPA